MSNDILFKVSVSDVLLSTDELADLVTFLRTKQFLDSTYRGEGKGFAGGTYDYKLSMFMVDKTTEQLRISPLREDVQLYLNTFGKENK